ncbi:MAG TPA: VOC family protein, partial [Chloroflexota bacterium]|nr:VOC family protein [Chloroflexota bacterium]
DGAGEPLVLLHPGLADGRVFEANLSGLAARFRVYRPARRGPGGPARTGITGLDHVALPVQRLEALLAFYEALGFDVPPAAEWRRSERPRLSIACGDQKLNLHAPQEWQDPAFTLRAPESRPGCGDLCFVWEGGVAALLERLRAAGAAVEAGPVERVGGRAGGRARGTSVYTRDPDGNLLEFIAYDA